MPAPVKLLVASRGTGQPRACARGRRLELLPSHTPTPLNQGHDELGWSRVLTSMLKRSVVVEGRSGPIPPLWRFLEVRWGTGCERSDHDSAGERGSLARTLGRRHVRRAASSPSRVGRAPVLHSGRGRESKTQFSASAVLQALSASSCAEHYLAVCIAGHMMPSSAAHVCLITASHSLLQPSLD